MSTATLWETAPATAAVQTRPAFELIAYRQRQEDLSEQIRVTDDLLSEPDTVITQAEKNELRIERQVAAASLIACANAITACEERMRREHARIQRTHGHLL